MAEQAPGEKTEAPTEKRKRKAVEDGNVLKSKDFAAALVVLAGCGWMALLGPALLAACKGVMTDSFAFGRAEVVDFEPFRALSEAAWKLGPSLAGLLALTFVAAILTQGALGSIGWNNKNIAFKGSRINPGSGLKRIFGMNGWIELAKSLLKVVLLGAVGYWMMAGAARPTLGLVSSNLDAAAGSLGGQFLALVFAMAGGLAIIAGIDVPIQLIQRLSKLKMSKQEIRDEHKEAEGSPENKAAQRQRQREVAKGGLRKHVATAHVVITNPTHFAVALRYDQMSDQVPVVVAKGRGQTALAIRELAAENAIPVLEYPALARAVYYTSREGQEVRDDLYIAIATVLAFVFGVNAAAGGTPPPVAVPPTARFDEFGRKSGDTP